MGGKGWCQVEVKSNNISCFDRFEMQAINFGRHVNVCNTSTQTRLQSKKRLMFGHCKKIYSTRCLSFRFLIRWNIFSSVWNFPIMPYIFLFSFLPCNSSKYSGRFIKLLILLHGVGKVMDRLFTPQHQLVLIALFSLVYLIASPMVFKDLPTPLLQALTLLVPPYFNSLSLYS